MVNKVPEVTIYFWIVKIIATILGETGADFISVNLNIGLTGTTYVISPLLLISLLLQIRSRKYVPWIYWSNVALISIGGTLITDKLVDNLGISLVTTTDIFSGALLVTFAAWYASERTLSIHVINTTQRELFYRAAILFTFALGTAGGDLVAEGLRLGYALRALVFGTLIGAVTIAFYRFKANVIATFWIAYILTRPFGASCGDFFSQPVANGGLGWGSEATNIFTSVISSWDWYPV